MIWLLTSSWVLESQSPQPRKKRGSLWKSAAVELFVCFCFRDSVSLNNPGCPMVLNFSGSLVLWRLPCPSCSSLMAELKNYLEFFMAIKEGFQENHHVWSHCVQILCIGIGSVHVTEASAHRVIHKQEAGWLQLQAPQRNNHCNRRLVTSDLPSKLAKPHLRKHLFLEVILGAGEIAQLVKSLPYEHTTLSLILRTHVKKKKVGQGSACL